MTVSRLFYLKKIIPFQKLFLRLHSSRMLENQINLKSYGFNLKNYFNNNFISIFFLKILYRDLSLISLMNGMEPRTLTPVKSSKSFFN